MFEVALFVKVRENPKLVFANVYIALLVAILLILLFITLVIYWIIIAAVPEVLNCSLDFYYYNYIGWDHKTCTEEEKNRGKRTSEIINVYWLIVSLVIKTIIFVYGRYHIKTMSTLQQQAKTFDVRKAQCGKAVDRIMLLGAIELKWGGRYSDELFLTPQTEALANIEEDSQETQELQPPSKGIHHFNLYIRQVLSENIKTRLMSETIYNIFPYALTCDTWSFFRLLDQTSLNWLPFWNASNILQTHTKRALLGWLVDGWFHVFFYAPLWGGSISCLGSMVLCFVVWLESLTKWNNYFSLFLWLLVYIVLEQLQESIFRMIYNIAFAAVVHPSGTEHYFAFVYFTYAKVTFSLTFGHVAQVFAVLYFVMVMGLTWLVYEPLWSVRLRHRILAKWRKTSFRAKKQISFSN